MFLWLFANRQLESCSICRAPFNRCCHSLVRSYHPQPHSSLSPQITPGQYTRFVPFPSTILSFVFLCSPPSPTLSSMHIPLPALIPPSHTQSLGSNLFVFRFLPRGRDCFFFSFLFACEYRYRTVVHIRRLVCNTIFDYNQGFEARVIA